MARKLILKVGAKTTSETPVYEGYEVFENGITANVGIDKTEEVFRHFIVMHDEPLFFILELPSNANDETEIAPGIAEKLHKDIYYMDGCSRGEALAVLTRVGDILYNDGISSFGFGCHDSGDEIMFGKYNVLTIYSRDTEKYSDFFDVHKIEKTKDLKTAWKTFTEETPGISEIYEQDGKSVFDIPKMFEDWGMYLAEQREEN